MSAGLPRKALAEKLGIKAGFVVVVIRRIIGEWDAQQVACDLAIVADVGIAGAGLFALVLLADL